MNATRTTHTHPSHHPPNTTPASPDAALSAPQPSEESAPFTEVIGRGKKARNTQSTRASPQQTTLTFAGAPPPPPTSSALVVSVDTASRVEETTEHGVVSARIGQRLADRVSAFPAAVGVTETGRRDQLTTSTRVIQHSSSTPSGAHLVDTPSRAAAGELATLQSAPRHGHVSSAPPSHTPTLSSHGVEVDGARMRDVAAAKRARELDTTHDSPTASEGSASDGHVHPSRRHCVGHSSSGSAARGNGKEEVRPADGLEKRRRTMPQHSTNTSFSSSSSSSSFSSSWTAGRDWAPTAEEFSKVVAELQASRSEADALRARLEQLERSMDALLSPRQPALGAVPSGLAAAAAPVSGGAAAAPSSVAPPAAPTGDSSSPQVPVASAQSGKSAAVAATAAGSDTASTSPAASRQQRAPHYSLAEPKAALLSGLSLSPYSATDLMLDVCLPPLTIKMARGRFPSHATQPANHRMGIVNLLQDAHGVQLHPPRVPLFVTKAHGEHDSIAGLQRSYVPDSREYRYLDGILQADMHGDECNPCLHSFADAECVSSWHQLLTLDTRIVSSQHQRKLHIRLALLNPLLTAAVSATVAAHMQQVKLSLAALHTRHPATGSRSGMTSPTPSVASTASSTGVEELSHPNASSMDEDTDSSVDRGHGLASLTVGAMHCTVSVSPFRLRYAMCTISNWPRAHPTELCSSNSHLTAFVRQHAPDVRLVTKEENGMTSASVTAFCQQRHLSQLVGLNGRVSEMHGIHFPLQLHITIHVMGAKTCTFCWQPNHGATHCPRRASSTNVGQHLSATPACRHCYSFAHTSDACTSKATKECTLCKKQAHSTSQCAHFFPSRLPLQQYLTPVPNNLQQQQRVAAGGTGGVPAPILSSAHSTAARPWQTGTATSATLSPAVAPRALNQPVQLQQATSVSEFVTPDQLTVRLAPILAALQQILGSRLFAEAAAVVRESQPLTAAAPVTSLTPSAAWQAPACTPTRVNEQSVLAH